MKGLCQVPGEEVTSARNKADVSVRLCESQDHSQLCVSVTVWQVAGDRGCSEQDSPSPWPSQAMPGPPLLHPRTPGT